MSMFDTFETDPAAEKEGVWIEYGDYRIRLARAGGANKEYQKVLERVSKPYRRAIATDSLDNEVAIELLRRTYAKTVITGWEVKVDGEFVSGIEQRDSDELAPFNQDNVIAALTALPALFTDLQGQASGIALFRASLREEASGN